MARMQFLAWVIALALVLVVLNALAVRDVTQRNYEIFPDMAYSAAYESVSPNPNFANRQTQQALPPGTVVHGTAPFAYGPTPEEAVRAGIDLANPYGADDVAAAARGAKVFQTFCVACHGPTGEGGGMVIQRGMVPPPSLLAEHARQMKDGQMFHVLTRGQGNMAAYAAQVLPEDRWKAILHVRSLQRGAK